MELKANEERPRRSWSVYLNAGQISARIESNYIPSVDGRYLHKRLSVLQRENVSSTASIGSSRAGTHSRSDLEMGVGVYRFD